MYIYICVYYIDGVAGMCDDEQQRTSVDKNTHSIMCDLVSQYTRQHHHSLTFHTNVQYIHLFTYICLLLKINK